MKKIIKEYENAIIFSVITIIVFAITIPVHEIGHAIMALFLGYKVNCFGFGGPHNTAFVEIVGCEGMDFGLISFAGVIAPYIMLLFLFFKNKYLWYTGLVAHCYTVIATVYFFFEMILYLIGSPQIYDDCCIAFVRIPYGILIVPMIFLGITIPVLVCLPDTWRKLYSIL